MLFIYFGTNTGFSITLGPKSEESESVSVVYSEESSSLSSFYI